MSQYELIIPCHFGMESVLKNEIYDIGYEITEVSDGRVTLLGDEEAVARTNIGIRTGDYLRRLTESDRAGAASESCGAVAETGVVATPSLLVSAESKNACCQLYSSTLMWPTSRETEPTTRESRPEDLTYALPVSSAIA